MWAEERQSDLSDIPDLGISLTQAQFLRGFSVKFLGGEMQGLSLVHLTVDDTGVWNLPIIQDRLLQFQFLAVKIDSDVPAGVNVTTCGDFSLLTCSLYFILYTRDKHSCLVHFLLRYKLSSSAV